MEFVPSTLLFNWIMCQGTLYFRYLQLSQFIKYHPTQVNNIVATAYDIASDAALDAISNERFEQHHNTVENVCKVATCLIRNAELKAGTKIGPPPFSSLQPLN